MTAMIWIGTALALAGAGVILWCLRQAVRLRSGAIPGDNAPATLRRLVAMNAGGLALAAIGLGVMIAGAIL